MNQEDPNVETVPQQSPAESEQPLEKQAEKRRSPWWKKFLKWTAIIVLSVILLVAGVISLVVWTLTPERLTPLVNKYASEYLLADVEAKRVELTFWSTFPRLSVNVDSLSLVSRTLRNVPDSVKQTLPADADSLLWLKHFNGGINITTLMAGNIELYDVDFADIRANLLQVDSLTNNFAIVPPSEPDTVTESAPLPDIAINRFTISDGMKVKFRAMADSLDCGLRLDRLNLTDSSSIETPLYALALNGDAAAAMPAIKIPTTPFTIDGKVQWTPKEPMQVGLQDFSISVGEVAAEFSTFVDMTESTTLKEFTAHIPQVEIEKIVKLLPEEYTKPLRPLDTDLSVELSAKLLKSYTVGAKELPVADVKFKADAQKVKFDRMQLSKLNADIEARVDCNNPDASTINVNNLAVTGKAIDFILSAIVTTPVTDPLINADFNGKVTIQNLPTQVLDMLPCAVRGVLTGKADINTRLSYLTPKLFHRAKINGELSLSDFRMAMTDGSMEAYIRKADFKLGSSSNITYNDHLVDSMLTASLSIDTIALMSPGVSLNGTTLSAGVGARNIASSTDTTRINPIGATIKAGRLHLLSDSDSVRVRLRDAQINASLQRYQSEARSPLLKTLIKSEVIRYADRYNRLGMRESEASLTLYPKGRPVMSARSQAVFDSIAAANPELSADSIKHMMWNGFKKRVEAYDKSREGREDVSVEIDNSVRSLLRRWNAHGTLKSKRGRLFTPYFPSRNTITNLNLDFSTDSVVLTDTRLKMNRSDFLLNGSVRNISRALMSRHGSPYEMEFSVKSDTIDINDLTATMLRGAVFADKISAGTLELVTDADSDESDETLQRQLDNQIPDSTRAAVIIPSNINANFSLKAKHVLYADLWLHGLDGLVEVFDGAVNLDRLRAHTSIGAVSFSALYAAPTINDLSIAAAVRIKRLNLRSVLDMMPEIDSLLPLLGEVRGIVDADLALTSQLDSMMNLDIPSLNLALKISGDSLQLLDNETFRTIAKWMMFKKKEKNMIDHMDVELAIHDGYIDLYPFIFDMDRYRIGVRGSNDAAFNLDYHVAVIKSPIPFKFGINIKGTPEKMKIRLGKARINEKTVAQSRQLTDTVRVNLVNEISRVFRRGIKATGSRGLRLQDTRKPGSGSAVDSGSDGNDNFTHADSVTLIQQGLIEKPAGFIMPSDTLQAAPEASSKKSKKKKK